MENKTFVALFVATFTTLVTALVGMMMQAQNISTLEAQLNAQKSENRIITQQRDYYAEECAYRDTVIDSIEVK